MLELASLLATHFGDSWKRKQELEEFQEYCKVAFHQILKPGKTRWLSLYKCIERILEQLNALILYFTSIVSMKPKEAFNEILFLLNLQNWI